MDRFPQYLQRPYRILWFEKDEIILLAGGYAVAYMYSFKFIVVLPIIFLLYRREKKRRPRGFFKHFGFLLGIVSLKKYPPSYMVRFNE